MVLVVLPEGRIRLILNVRPTRFLCPAGIAIELDPHGIQARQNLTIRSEIGTGREPDHLCGAEADPCRGDSQCGRTETPSKAGCFGRVCAEVPYGWSHGTGHAVHRGAALAAAGGAWCWKVNCRRRSAGGGKRDEGRMWIVCSPVRSCSMFGLATSSTLFQFRPDSQSGRTGTGFRLDQKSACEARAAKSLIVNGGLLFLAHAADSGTPLRVRS